MRPPPRFSPATLRLLERFLAAPSRWLHGYTLLRELDLRSGTLYPVLMRLADAGWLQTRWDPPAREGRPPRHLYRLTPGAAPDTRALVQDWKARALKRSVPRHAT